MPYSHLRDRSLNDAFFRYVADYTYDWESWHDPLGKLVWVNASVERMTGFTVDQCMEMKDYPLPIVAPKDRSRIAKMIDDAIAKTSFNDLEFEIICRSSETRAMAVSWQPMYDDRGTHLGFRTSVRDITDRQGLKEQLRLYTEHLEQIVEERTTRIAQLENHRRQMEKMAALGELAAGVAHEVNNPLAGIRNAFALFRADLSPGHEHYELLELVDREIERISGIIHQMYQLYRHVPLESSEFVLEKVIEDIRCLLEPISRRHQVKLGIHGLPSTTVVRLPEGELKQVLFNLIRNAIQASRPGEEVVIEVQVEARNLCIRVVDRGSGIPEDILPFIFDPFFTTKSHIKEGMGLGLSVSKNLIEVMQGRIDVQTVVGQGTTFVLYLPRAIA